MKNNSLNLFGISNETAQLVARTEEKIQPILAQIDARAEQHQYQVIKAMQNAGLAERHFLPATGYGYNDAGREAAEAIYAEVFGAEAALVRPHISSGTHAIACALYGVLRPGDELLAITGSPYDTVCSFIGRDPKLEGSGTLKDLGVVYKEVQLNAEGRINIPRVLARMTAKTKMVYLQRSTGYSWRKALTLQDMAVAVKKIKEAFPNVIIFLDNCYGEFMSETEPLSVGVDLIAGSMIKNPGGGLAPTGGYVAGRKDLVHLAACRLAAPGVAGETGATMDYNRTLLQGLFLAPTVTAAAVKNAVLMGAVYQELGFAVCPLPEDERSDIIQSIRFEDPERIQVFCRAVQEAAPVDSFVTPEPWDMPGYDVPVIMAAGAFIQGSSIELSADAPIREPYIAYFQGGLTHAHGKLGIMLTVERLREAGMLNK